MHSTNYTNQGDTTTSLDEQHLAMRLREGNEAAYATAYQRYHRHLYHIALFYLKDPELAEDALQDVFLKLWLNRHILDEQQSIKAFLSVTLKNHVLNMIRTRQREIMRYLEFALNQPVTETAQELLTETPSRQTLLDQAIAELSPQKQRIVKLRVFDCLTNDEVARQLGLSINTVKFQYSQATQLMRDFVRRHDPSGVLLAALLLIFS